MDSTTLLLLFAVVAAFANLVGLIAFWMKLGARLAVGENAHASAKEAHERIDEIEREFSRYREQAAKEFLTSRTLVDAENRMTKAVEDLRADMREQTGAMRSDLQGLNARFDKFLQSELERAQGRD